MDQIESPIEPFIKFFFFAKTRTSPVVFKYLDRFKGDPKIVKKKTDRGKKPDSEQIWIHGVIKI